MMNFGVPWLRPTCGTHQTNVLPKPLTKRKPTSVTVRRMQFSHRRNVGCFVTNQHRCLQNLHSRLLEIRRRGLLLTEIHDQDPLLAKKIFRSPHFDRRLGLTRNIQAIHALLQECEDTERKVRLSAWSEKMTKDKAALAWLRRKPQLTHVNVTADDTGPASMSVQDAIANVAVFWRQIWHRPKLNVHTVWPEIQQLVPAHVPSVWAPLTGTHLKAAAYDSRNRAAGLDGWTPQELILFNMDMWNAVADFYSHCLVVGIVPEFWKCFRQVQLGKGDIAPTSEFVYAKQLRPICVSSLIWRVCQKAQFNHTDAQTWIRSVFPSCFYGGIKGRGTDDAIAPLLFKAHQDWFIGSLDLAKAFDMTSPQLAAKIPLRCGMPQHILTLVLDVWENQKRWIQYLGQSSPEPELARNSLPQGDSWSMLTMLAVLYPCVLAIQHEFPDVDQILYADDRSFAAPSAQRVVQVTQLWAQWAAKMGLKENEGKAQFWHQSARGQHSLAPKTKSKNDMKILGCHFVIKQNRQINDGEKRRLSESQKNLLRTRALPGSISRRSRLAQMTMCPKAGWGWVCKRPSIGDSKPLLQACKMLFKWPQHGSMDLILLIQGHHWDLILWPLPR